MNRKRVGLYLRVSTDDQTVENQREALVAACEARNWRIAEELLTTVSAAPRPRETAGVYRPSRQQLGARSISLPPGASTGWGELARPGRFPQRAKRSRLRLLSRTASRGHDNTGRTGAFPDARRLCRIRAGDHPGAGKAGMARARRCGTRSGKPIGQQPLPWHKVERIRAAEEGHRHYQNGAIVRDRCICSAAHQAGDVCSRNLGAIGRRPLKYTEQKQP